MNHRFPEWLAKAYHNEPCVQRVMYEMLLQGRASTDDIVYAVAHQLYEELKARDKQLLEAKQGERIVIAVPKDFP